MRNFLRNLIRVNGWMDAHALIVTLLTQSSRAKKRSQKQNMQIKMR